MAIVLYRTADTNSPTSTLTQCYSIYWSTKDWHCSPINGARRDAFCQQYNTIAMHGNWQSMTYQMMKYRNLKRWVSPSRQEIMRFLLLNCYKECWMGLILVFRKLQILSRHVVTGYWYFSTDWSKTRRPRRRTNSTGLRCSGFRVRGVQVVEQPDIVTPVQRKKTQ